MGADDVAFLAYIVIVLSITLILWLVADWMGRNDDE